MTNKLAAVTALSLALSGAGGVAFGQSAPNDQFVSKEEYNKLLQRYEQLEKHVTEIMNRSAAVSMPQASSTPPTNFVSQAAFDSLKKEVEETHSLAKSSFLGSTKMNLTGYGSAGFISQNHNGERKFNAQFNPLFLWKLSDKVFFEGEMEFELEGANTIVNWEQAHLSYLANDYVTVDAGKFLNPMNSYVERFHMAWVNRLPDQPLAVYDGLLPETLLGAQLRGGVPLGPTKFNYSIFAANSFPLSGDNNGMLDFGNFDNLGQNFVGGGHVGFLPIPQLEVGYGMMMGQMDGAAGNPTALFQSVDLNFVQDSEALRGLLRLNAQWVWSHVGGYAYTGQDPFHNSRNGGYAQISYRPTKWGSAFLSKLEPVFRFDTLQQKNTPAGTEESRYTMGLNYWLGPITVVKFAYQFDHNDGDIAHNAWLLQFATGF